MSDAEQGTARNDQRFRRCVMIVDDDADLNGLMAGALAAAGYDVVSALTGDEAIDLMARHRPPVAIVDVRLGRADGYDLIEQLRAMDPDLRYIVVTAFGDVDGAVYALRDGAEDYLTKPFGMSALREAVDRCFQDLRVQSLRTDVEQAWRRRYDEMSAFSRQLRRLLDSVRRLATCETTSDLLRCLLEELGALLSATGGSVYHRRDEELVLVHALDPGHAPPRIPLPLTVGTVFGRLYEHRVPILATSGDDLRRLVRSQYGAYRSDSFLGLPIAGEAGAIVGVLALHDRLDRPFNQDDLESSLLLTSYVTESLRLVQAVDALRAQRTAFRDAQRLARVGLIDWDVDRDRVSLSGLVADLLRPPPHRPLSCEDLIACVDPADRDRVRACVRQSLEAGRPYELEHRIVLPEGDLHWVVQRGDVVRDETGRVRFVRGAIVDVTDRHVMQERLGRSLQEAHRARRLTDEYLAVITHDLRAPLMNVRAALTTLSETAFRSPDRDLYLDIALRNVDRIERLIENLLEVARIQSDRLHLNRRAVDLHELVAGVVEEMRPHALRQGISLEVERRSGVVRVVADPDRLIQALSNLLSNALRFAATTVRVAVAAAPRQGAWLLVEDDGPGLDPIRSEQLFRPYTRGSERTEEGDLFRGHVGLGLAIVAGFVEAHGGRVEVVEPGDERLDGLGRLSGARFLITLPHR